MLTAVEGTQCFLGLKTRMASLHGLTPLPPRATELGESPPERDRGTRRRVIWFRFHREVSSFPPRGGRAAAALEPSPSCTQLGPAPDPVRPLRNAGRPLRPPSSPPATPPGLPVARLPAQPCDGEELWTAQAEGWPGIVAKAGAFNKSSRG